MTLLNDIEAELAALKASHRFRSRADQRVENRTATWVDVSSNDYLGLAREGVSRETLDALTALPAGSGASRLIHGTHPEHVALEAELASWIGQEEALLFSSGYAANVGLVTALAGPEDLLVSDALNHASTIDGCRLARAAVQIVPHRDLAAVAQALERPARRKWVLTETYFSMEGDTPDLEGLRRLCDAHGAGLLVDEAHALGVFGPAGAGLCRHHGVSADAVVGTLGKAVGVQGAFIAGPRPVIDWLWNRARSFVFSTAPSPILARLTRFHVKSARAADQRRQRLQELGVLFEQALGRRGIALPAGRQGPIFPILIGEDERAQAIARDLLGRGFLTQAIRPPTVPSGTARLRVALHADLEEADLERLADALEATCRKD